MDESPISISTENLHQQYPYPPSRTHSLQTTPINETPADEPFMRRASDPAATVYGRPGQQYNEDFRSWSSHQAYTPEDSIPESPAMDAGSGQAHWGAWDVVAKREVDEWAPHGGQHLSPLAQEAYPTPHIAHSPEAYGGDECVRAGSAESYASMGATYVYVRHPPSPLLDAADAFHLAGAGMIKAAAAPSPPESPGFAFAAQPDYARAQVLAQWPAPAYPYADRRRGSVPPTPPSRPASAAALSTAALAAALAAKQQAAKAKLRSGARRKASSAAMRSGHGRQLGHHHHGHGAPHHHGAAAADAAEMSFVNYTAEDAGRILSGVAPSGSSKTKARREREANERRRKLIEETERAVMAAGGDASALATKIDQL